MGPRPGGGVGGAEGGVGPLGSLGLGPLVPSILQLLEEWCRHVPLLGNVRLQTFHLHQLSPVEGIRNSGTC